MNKSKKIRSIFRELRAAVGDKFTSGELLKIANTLLVIDNKSKADKIIHHQNARRSFDELGLDEAFADGGWRVMCQERDIVNTLSDDMPHPSEYLKFAQSLQMELIW